jgi:uncharacterized membrane protein
MSDRALRVAVASLSLAGAALAAYLLSVRHSGAELLCTTGGCASVQRSRYAEVLGVPVAALGLVSFLLIGASALLSSRPARAAAASLALGAVVFSAYLLVVQVAVIGAVCDWCLAADVVTASLAVLALLRLRGGLAPPGAAPT